MEQVKLHEASAMGVIDTVIVFRLLKLFSTKWEDMEAFKQGLIDEKGKRLKKVKPKTKEQKDSYTLLHRLVFNLKRILELIPFGKSRLANYAAALALLKENFGLNSQYLEEKFYQYLKEQGKVSDLLEEFDATQNTLSEGHIYTLRTSLWNDDDNIGYRHDKVQIIELTDRIMGVNIYKGYNKTQDKVQFLTGQDVR